MSTKVSLGFFLSCLDLQLFTKIKKDLTSLTETIFINNSRSKQNKRNPEHSFVDTVKFKTCVKFHQKILKPMVVGARQSFQFFRQLTWFLENNRV